MLLASNAGHRVVLVFATRGECGEVTDGFLDEGETLGERRETEARAAAVLLGVHRVEFLGYRDSGMDGEATNDDPECFWQADVEEAAARLAAILVEESADVVSLYDSHGGYGHPDHIQVHRVGHRAAELARTSRVYEATMNRDTIRELRALADEEELPDTPEVAEADNFGTPASEITTGVDVSTTIRTKRLAMAAHGSQIGDDSFFLSMPEEIFTKAFGVEWFIRTDEPTVGEEDWIFAELHPERA